MDVSAKARSLYLLVQRLKRPFHAVKPLSVAADEKVHFSTAEEKTAVAPVVNSQNQISATSASFAERLDRIEAKIDSFQQRRRPSIVQGTGFKWSKILLFSGWL